MKYFLTIIIIIILGALSIWYFQSRLFSLPSGETTSLGVQENGAEGKEYTQREILVTDGVKHSIPLNEILSGGPGKDGIPSIDKPEFWITAQADSFLNDDDIGLALEYKGEARFYPFRILVWHEIVNDVIAGDPILVTYCPLCLKGIVFERKVNGETQEFGVSGMLWQSNLLMYNRAGNPEKESLWSQILGEAVLGDNTGEKLKIISSDIIKWSDWKKIKPTTLVLSTKTDTTRNYARDLYDNYYSDQSVSFGATFNDDRLHPKALVFGVELGNQKKAYSVESLPEGELVDHFAGKDVVIQKDSAGRVKMSVDDREIPLVWGFWFSWLAVHPETELYKQNI